MKGKLRPLLVIAGIWLFIWFISRADWSRMFGVLVNVSWPLYLSALGLSYMQYVVSASKWDMLLRHKGISIHFARLYRTYLIGSFISSFLPGRYGGDVYRGYVAAGKPGQNYDSAAAIILERVTGLVTLAFIGLFTSIYWSHKFHDAKLALVIAGILMALLGMSLLLFSRRSFAFIAWAFRKIHLARLIGPAEKFHTAISDYRLNKALLGKVLLMSALYNVHTFFIWYFSLLAVGAKAPMMYIALITPIIAILEALPISFSGLGLREGAFIFFFTRLGLPYEHILAFSMVVLLNKTVANLTGGLLLMCQPFEWRSFKTVTKERNLAA